MKSVFRHSQGTERSIAVLQEADAIEDQMRSLGIMDAVAAKAWLIQLLVRYFVLPDAFANLSKLYGIYGSGSAAHRAHRDGTVPEDKAAMVLRLRGVTPHRMRTAFSLEWQRLQLVYRCVSALLWSDDGEPQGKNVQGLLTSVTDIAMTLAIVSDRTLLREWNWIATGQSDRCTETEASLVAEVIRRVGTMYHGRPDGIEFREHVVDPEFWRDRMVRAFNRYHVGVWVALDLFDELMMDPAFAIGPIGQWFPAELNGYWSMTR
jgi:hypothetical protein